MSERGQHRWTDAEEDQLRALWAEGRPAREIALAIDQSGALTTESVGAKRQHLGLAKRGQRAPDWSDENIARLKTMWSEGQSASQIAREIGKTRNAVIGKAHRLGLSGSDKPRATASPRSTKPRAISPPHPLRLPPTPLSPTPSLVEPLRVKMADLEFFHCRWPLWGADGAPDGFLHCGRPKSDGSYCAGHARLARGTGTPSERRAGPGIARSERGAA